MFYDYIDLVFYITYMFRLFLIERKEKSVLFIVIALLIVNIQGDLFINILLHLFLLHQSVKEKSHYTVWYIGKFVPFIY